VARFDGGTISSDGGAFLLRQTDKRLNLLPRLEHDQDRTILQRSPPHHRSLRD
jgi:hypothetical protein